MVCIGFSGVKCYNASLYTKLLKNYFCFLHYYKRIYNYCYFTISMSTKKKIEDIYPLTPLQKGMLFHCLRDPESSVYFEQMTCRLDGKFNEVAFFSAWQTLVERHTILRTSFVWKGQREPVQVVNREAVMPWNQHDWRGISPDEQKKKLAECLSDEQKQGFVLNRAPLMRVVTIRLSDESHQFVWCHHHLLLDGWSLPLLMKEFFTLYQAKIGRASCRERV